MKIVCISDTHIQHKQLGILPMADVLVHCGDVTLRDTEEEVMDFMQWFCSQPHKYKVLVWGNHDDCMYGNEISGISNNTYLLNGNSVMIEGKKFYGIPMLNEYALNGQYDKMIDSIPQDTDVLVTHEPPYGILAGGGGDLKLLKQVNIVRPKLHLFGHAHEIYGVEEHNGIRFVNSCLVNNKYDIFHDPIVIEI